MRNRYHHLEPMNIKNRIAPFDFYLKEQALDCFKTKSRGWAEAGLCPFHNDNNAGSFRVNLQNGAYKCFSCEAKGGDIIAFTQTKYGLTFREALNKLANEWGVC